MAGIRQSKFKHIYGKANKREDSYECIRITKSSSDSVFCAVNPKFLAVITEAAGGGAFLVLPIEKTGRVPADYPLVSGHTAAVLDIEWCPHNDNIIASGSEDCTVKIWEIPDGGLLPKTPLIDPVVNLRAHQRRVNIVLWHPSAKFVLVSAGADNVVIVWNVDTGSPLKEISFPKLLTSMSFNLDGSLLATCCKDGLTRILDPRSGETITSGKCHEGAKPQQCVYLSNNRIFTTGFSRMSERQFSLWDESNLNSPLSREEVDTSNGVLFPFYDVDCQLIYLCGKGDCTIRYFEYSPDEGTVYYLDRADSSDPQRGFAFMPKRGLNVHTNEIGRYYKLHNSNWCEVIPYIVPRRSELFQDDLYPNTAGSTPALTADEWWIEKKNANPILVSLKSDAPTRTAPARSATSLSARLQSDHPKTGATLSPNDARSREVAAASAATDQSNAHLLEKVEDLTKEVKYLTTLVNQLQQRVQSIEGASTTTSAL